MSSLREIKDRIGSVKSTLKITSAMKLVASSKLRKAQKAIETLRPYEETLCGILSSLTSGSASGQTPPTTVSLRSTPPQAVPPLTVPRVAWVAGAVCPDCPDCPDANGSSDTTSETAGEGSVYGGAVTACGLVNGRGSSDSLGDVMGVAPHQRRACEAGMERSGSHAETFPFDGGKKAVVVISSNSSLCGGFNGNVVKKALEVVKACGDVEVFAIGRRGADALRKAGYPSDDWSELVAKPSYALSDKLARKIAGRFSDGEYSQVILVYNHFVTTAHQEVAVEQYLPFAAPVAAVPEDPDLYIVEPGRKEVLEELLPKVVALKFHAAILDSAAAEHAARTVAMQTATDNAQDLLDELTLEYNKGRQQKITSEILDLLGGKTE